MNYIKRSSEGIIIDGKEINITLKKYLNSICILDGSTLNGRIQFSKNVLKCNLVPIYINDDIILSQTASMRVYEVIIFNALELEKYHVIGSSIQLTFYDGQTILVDCTIQKFKSQLCKVKSLVKFIKKRKCLHRRVIDRFYISNQV